MSLRDGSIEGFVTPCALPIILKFAVAVTSGVVLTAYLRRGRPRAQTAG